MSKKKPFDIEVEKRETIDALRNSVSRLLTSIEYLRAAESLVELGESEKSATAILRINTGLEYASVAKGYATDAQKKWIRLVASVRSPRSE